MARTKETVCRGRGQMRHRGAGQSPKGGRPGFSISNFKYRKIKPPRGGPRNLKKHAYVRITETEGFFSRTGERDARGGVRGNNIYDINPIALKQKEK